MKPNKKPTKTKLKAWLKANGHASGKVDKMKLDTPAEMRATLFELHGVRNDIQL